MNLADAQQARHERGEQLAESQCEELADELCDALQLASTSGGPKNYQLVGPAARKKLSGLLNHYRKMAKPFTACVRDNTKRFGPGGAKKVCAVLTDLEKGTTKWRSGGGHKMSLLGEMLATPPEIDADLLDLLEALGSIDYSAILDGQKAEKAAA